MALSNSSSSWEWLLLRSSSQAAAIGLIAGALQFCSIRHCMPSR